MENGGDATLESGKGEWLIDCLIVLLLWGLVAFLPGLVLGILISLAWHGGISLATVGVVIVITGVLLHVALVLYTLWGTHRADLAAAERLSQDPGLDFTQATFETIQREFPHLEFTDGGEAYYHFWDSDLFTGSVLLSELRAFGVDAELTRCWSPDNYSTACEITVSGQPIASIVLADSDGVGETEFLISDPRIQTSTQQIKLRTIRSKTFPVFGQVRGVVWKGADLGTGLTESLNENQGFRGPFLQHSSLTLWLDNERSSWVLSVDEWPIPTWELWRCYTGIADLLLRSPLPSS